MVTVVEVVPIHPVVAAVGAGSPAGTQMYSHAVSVPPGVGEID
jgi:hypothetical protein